MNTRSMRTLLGFALFTAASAFYIFTTGQHSFWLDSTEFVTMASNAGVAHPPGTPLYLLLANLFTLAPVGAAAFRVHLLNALLGGVLAWLLFELALWAGTVARQPQQDPEPLSWPLLVGAAAVAGALAVSPAVWFQSVRAEVYNLNSVVQLVLIHLAIKWVRKPEEWGYALCVGAVAGLGMANHHFLVALTLAALLVFLLADKAVRKTLLSPRVFWLLVPLAAGLATYLYLPIRGWQGWRLWGDPGSFSGLWSMLSAEAFHVSVTEMPRASVPVALLVIFEKWLDLMGFPLLLASVAGLVFLLVKSPRAGLLVLALVLAGGLSKAVMYLDVENPDDHAYFLVGIQALAASAAGLFQLLRLRNWSGYAGRLAPVSVCLVLVLCAGASGAANYSANRRTADLSGFAGGDVLNRHFHESLPPDALFMPSYYATFFNHLYYREVEQRRPDVDMVHQSLFSRFDQGRGYAADMTARNPELGPLFGQFIESQAFPLAELEKLSHSRPVVLENDTLALTVKDERFAPFALGKGGLPLPDARLEFAGPGLMLVDKAGDASARFERQQSFWTALYQDLEGTPLHPELSKLLLWYHYRNALHFINAGILAAALLEVRMAQGLSSGESRLLELDALLNQCMEEERFIRDRHPYCR